jgi:pentatricopeptide repeat protein
MANVILSYRRLDSGTFTGRIFDRLVASYGRDAVFRDIDSIPIGVDFRPRIADAIRECDVLLAIIGSKWLGRSGKSGAVKIKTKDDFVRIEIETALRLGKPIIPVLVGNTRMPKIAQVPKSLSAFVYLNGLKIDTDRDFDHHVEDLLREIEQISQSSPTKPASALRPAPVPARSFFSRPSIAVLPFKNMSGDPAQDYFADGMVEEIITALSHISWLFVVARNSSFSYKGRATDLRQVGRELGVRYVVKGSVRKNGDQVRIAAQLIEAKTRAHLWADKFDSSLDDVFDLQDRVARSVAGVIEPTLQASEVQRAARQPIKDLTAYDLYLRAHAFMLSPARRIVELEELFDKMFERDPDFGPALALAATFHMNSDIFGWCDDYDANCREGLDRGRQALLMAKDDPTVLVNAAFALGFFGEDIHAMITLVDRALSLNPSFARGWHASGCLRLWAGQPDIAIEHLELSLRLSPRTRVGWSLYAIAAAHIICERFEEAIPKLLLALQEDATPVAYQALIACYAHLGRLEDASETLNRLRSIRTSVPPPASRITKLVPEFWKAVLSGVQSTSNWSTNATRVRETDQAVQGEL